MKGCVRLFRLQVPPLPDLHPQARRDGHREDGQRHQEALEQSNTHRQRNYFIEKTYGRYQWKRPHNAN